MKKFNVSDVIFYHSGLKLMLRAVENINTAPPLYKIVFDIYMLHSIMGLLMFSQTTQICISIFQEGFN